MRLDERVFDGARKEGSERSGGCPPAAGCGSGVAAADAVAWSARASRAVQRAFWRFIADGVTTEDAAAEVGVSTPWGPDGSATLVGCRRSAWPSPPVATCRWSFGTSVSTPVEI